MRPMMLFTIATLSPAVLIGLAAVFGGIWAFLAPVYMTVLTATLDEVIRRVTPPVAESEFPAANRLSIALALAHFTVLGLVVANIAALPLPVAIGTFIGAGLFVGQVSNSNAHELIHRQSRALRRLGMWVYISVLFGHHTSAHMLVHHPKVATAMDPNSARLGEGFYRFFARAWRGSFRAGLRAETERLAKAGKPRWQNPYITYFAGAAMMIALAALVGGLWWYIGLAMFAQVQLLLSDYVQHYGLRRTITHDRPEPIAPRHSWNSPHWYSSALMLNAPRHSDHHAHPMTPYPALVVDGPTLPRSLPVMACVALYPRLWRRIMDPRVSQVTDV